MKRLAFLFSVFLICCSFGVANAIDINGEQNLDFASYVREHPNETEIVINAGSTIILTPGIELGNTQIIINNGVGIYVDGINSLGDTKLLSNVTAGSYTTVHTRYIDSMYLSNTRWSGGALYVHTVRQTNYSIVLGGNLGSYLDANRAANPNDKLLNALDAATNRRALNDVMKKSGRLNPMKIIDNVGTVNSFVLNDWNGNGGGFSIMPLYLYSKNFSAMGGNANLSFDLSNNLHGTIGGQFAKVNYTDAFDEWSGVVYGGNVGLLYSDSDVYIRSIGVFSVANFDGPNVFDGTINGTKPRGVTAYGTIDGGPVFSFMGGNAKFIPFVGLGVKYISALDDSDITALGRMGANVEFKSNIDGNLYGYGARIYAQSDGDIYAGVFSNMFSTADGFGGDLGFGVLYNDDIGVSYKISLNAKIEF